MGLSTMAFWVGFAIVMFIVWSVSSKGLEKPVSEGNGHNRQKKVRTKKKPKEVKVKIEKQPVKTMEMTETELGIEDSEAIALAHKEIKRKNQKPAKNDLLSSTVPENIATRNPTSTSNMIPTRPVSNTGPRVLKLVGESKPQVSKPKREVVPEMTKKQRENKKKADKLREAKANQAQMQEQRLLEFKKQRARELMIEQDMKRVAAAKLEHRKPDSVISADDYGPWDKSIESENWEPVESRKAVKERKKSVQLEDDIPDSRYSVLRP
ncbi:hypothetical protein V1512DRAFT_268207 [Lipomyces arxii]|uniref:uncharacterized protein n=1 Tax=Lipomyces arxii TaxID=56418 RepID=UPI0034CDAA76